MKLRPWWVTTPRANWTAEDLRAARAEGWKPSAAETRTNVLEQQRIRESRHLPQQPMIFGAAVERPERKEERERRRNLARLMKKFNLDDKSQPIGWRL